MELPRTSLYEEGGGAKKKRLEKEMSKGNTTMSQLTAPDIMNTRVTRAKASIMQEAKNGSQIAVETKILEKPKMAVK